MPPAPNPRVFPAARAVLDTLLAGLDEAAPGLVTGLDLIGSIALDDGRPGQSDIDFVLMRVDGADNAATMAALAPVLAALRRAHPRPTLDGIVLSAGDLMAGPDGIAGERPIVFDSRATLATGGSAWNPVTWATLRQGGIAYAGAPIAPDRLWHDPARLDAWTRENLAAYWRPWLARSGRTLSRFGIVSLGAGATEWGVLGVTRLHATLATGAIVSKRGAGDYALDRFPPRWHPIVMEAIRIRERQAGGRYRSPLHRHREMRAYMAMVIDDALALPQHNRKDA